jgi:putative sterol carrier protein
MSTAATPQATQNISYTDLYSRWERGHWLATEIDFTQDRIDWQEKLTAEQRQTLLWFFALFFHGEDEVTDDLSPYVTAAPTEEQTYFLTTQQVDEARHAIFFNRFMHEVVGLGDGTAGSGLQATEVHLTWGHRKAFENLSAVAKQLQHDQSAVTFASAITNYHIIVEGTLAQPGQHLLESWLERSELLPGFLEGMRHVSIDEQRHIAFGMKTLSDLYADDPDHVGQAIVDAIRTTGTYLMAFAYPNNGDSDFLAPLGLRLQDLYADSMRSLTSRLRGIGLSEDHRRKALTIDPTLSFEQQGELMMRLLDAGYIGDGRAPRSKRPEDVGVFFQMLRAVVKANAATEDGIVQFDLTDLGPRHYVIANGEVTYFDGAAANPSVSIRASFDDLLDLVGERANPLRLLITRRLKVSGDRGLLVGKRSIFGPPPASSARRTPILAKLGLA